jgi:DNA-binding response OmpR family regulator
MTAPLHPCCLVAEDQALIGMALEAYLDEIGMAVAGPFASCEQALAWVEHATPHIALLDFRLNDGPCTTLARILRGRGVPVVFYSGLPSGGPEIPDDLLDVVWIEKPVDRNQLVSVLVNLTASKLNPTFRRAPVVRQSPRSPCAPQGLARV